MKAPSIGILMASISALVVNTQGQTLGGSLTNGLLAYYPFNGTANDVSGNGHHGTNFGAILTADRFGTPNSAYNFNGVDSFIYATIPEIPTGSAPRTISLVARPQPEIVQGVYLLFWGTNENTRGFGPLNISTPYQWAAGGWGGGNGLQTGVLIDTNWHHIVQTYTGSAISMWIDGVNYGSNNVPIDTPISPLLIGSGPGQEFFAGTLDELRVYNRVLAPQEIAQLFRFDTGQNAGIACVPAITYAGNPGDLYTIQYSTNLGSTNWSSLASNVVLQTNYYLYTDTNAFGQSQRYYRVIPE
jgi:hypothetical protein